MRNLDLDYAISARPYPLWLRLGLLLLALGLIVSMWLHHQGMEAEMAASQLEINSHAKHNQSEGSSPELLESLSHAEKTQQALHYPWLQLLSSLEEVKQKHPDVRFLNIMPNKTRAEMRLEGEAKNFDDITLLLNDLKRSADFDDAVLINQYLVEADSLDENNGQPIYTFNILVKWQK